MAVKTFQVDDIGTVSIHKSKRSKHLRLSVRSDGTIRVAIPYWVSYAAGLHFVSSRKDWLQQQIMPKQELKHGDRIGKYHRLIFVVSESVEIRTRVSESEVIVYYPQQPDADKLQLAIEKACTRALKQECEKLLVQRLRTLATNNNYEYNSVSVRQLKGRWGSCSTKKDIVLSCYLIQLSWDEIDYVLLHELTHTIHMSHSSKFWDHLTSVYPKAKTTRKQMKERKPIVFAAN